MKPEIKAKWVEALRSGDFKQGKGYLNNRDDNSFCCLGVLCEINADKRFNKIPVIVNKKNDKEKTIVATSFRIIDDSSETESSIFYLTKNNMEYFGLDATQCQSLMDMNDGVETVVELVTPKTFNEIADWIEENL
jgi:hypothetical protein